MTVKAVQTDSSASTLEAHFQLMIYLMLLFFVVHMATSALLALGITKVQIGGDIALNAFFTFFGIAVGIFRGMSPQGGELPPNTESTTQTVTTTATVTPPAIPIAPPLPPVAPAPTEAISPVTP